MLVIFRLFLDFYMENNEHGTVTFKILTIITNNMHCKLLKTQNIKMTLTKASARIRTFLFDKIYQFRKPLANYHIPQNTMLRFRFFYEFLLANERPTAQEIKDEYLDTVSKVYYS